MCGLNGIFAFNSAAPDPSEAELVATRDHMAARGPDGFGAWRSAKGRCALGHRRLAIIDLDERALQPMLSEDGQTAIVFNGEIYNYADLRAELEGQGQRFRTTSDTETLLHLYRRDGVAMVERLRGMFAFAIWDGAKQGLFLARDPYGIKPLYYANDGWTFRFASQVKALMAGGAISDAPEPAGAVGFMLYGSVPEPFTLYREVRALPAGCTQWVDAAGPRQPTPFVSLSGILAGPTARDARDLDAQVRSAVLDSVRTHMIADVEVGVFLSAGIDSGALLGLMRDAGQTRVRAITLGFDEFIGTPEDEAPLAAEVANLYGAEHIVRRVARREFEDDLPAILAAMDQPSIDGVNTWFVAKAAKEAGLKVALSGLGGDELLAGYPSFADIPRWVNWLKIPAAAPGLGVAARGLVTAFAPGMVGRSPKAAGMLEYGGDYAGAYLLRRGVFLPFELKRLLSRAFVREGMRRLAPLRRLNASLTPRPSSPLARVSALESANYMRNQLLRDADWAGMAHSLEIRTPLVDIALLRALAPLTASFGHGAGKRALARAPSTPLPAHIAERAKTGFVVPTNAWVAEAAGVTKGQTSRGWAREVYARQIQPLPPRAA